MSCRSWLRSAVFLLSIIALKGQTHPKAVLKNDLGPVDASFPLVSMTLFLKAPPERQIALDQLLRDWQNPNSSGYHRWLQPEEFARRFGPGDRNISAVSDWLRAGGFTVSTITRGRTVIVFSGTAEQVRNSFHTAIHRYRVDGAMHFANNAEPSVPPAFENLISGIGGLHDFYPKPRMTAASGTHSLAPGDLAAIYNIAPLFRAGIDGSGQKLAIVGGTAIDVADIQAFRNKFNLPAKDPDIVLVPNFADPGRVAGAVAEADLDIEWSGAVARNATITYVYSKNAFNALIYAIDQNLAPVISVSFGACEPENAAVLAGFHLLAQQANSQGITLVSASGDTGAAGCDPPNALVAQNGPSVGFPASLPEVTGVGGTQFSEAGGVYWNTANDANGGSAISYIPEIGWNESAARGGLAASGGGPSGFFPKPMWQTGKGVPDDNVRHVPDVALASGIQHDGYYVATGGASAIFGGTSVAAPSFAGVVALLNQYLISSGAQSQSGVGNINPNLYRLAQDTAGVFHDVTAGGNTVPCAAGSPGCIDGTFGFTAGPGYDQVTGLGSIDADNLIHQWTSQPASASSVVPAIGPNPVYQVNSDANVAGWPYTIILTEEAGIATRLTGFTVDDVDNSARIA
ncbi:MAG: S53 family peptidase, partial [Acidobacteriota bacterium]|nr:S53 family peptidase [Acidobacteriota bacterium]